MLNKAKASGYNDGVVAFYRRPIVKSTFAAKSDVNPEPDPSDLLVTLAFSQQSAREADLSFAEAHGWAISLKVKTRRVGCINKGCLAVVGDYLYEVRNIDPTQTELYIYLEEVCEL